MQKVSEKWYQSAISLMWCIRSLWLAFFHCVHACFFFRGRNFLLLDFICATFVEFWLLVYIDPFWSILRFISGSPSPASYYIFVYNDDVYEHLNPSQLMLLEQKLDQVFPFSENKTVHWHFLMSCHWHFLSTSELIIFRTCWFGSRLKICEIYDENDFSYDNDHHHRCMKYIL